MPTPPIQKHDPATGRSSESTRSYPLEFSFCTLVNDIAMYENMIDAFSQSGFTADKTEFLAIHNTQENAGDGYQGLNELARHARGKYIVFCHQDLLPIDACDILQQKIDELDKEDPAWGVAGNAGIDKDGKSQRRITDKFGENQKVGNLPAPVVSLDENFILMKADCRISFSQDIEGFHCYATNLAAAAEFAGWSTYAIDFHLKHTGHGSKSEAFDLCRQQILKKFSDFARPRIIRTPSTRLYVGSSRRFARNIMNKLWM